MNYQCNMWQCNLLVFHALLYGTAWDLVYYCTRASIIYLCLLCPLFFHCSRWTSQRPPLYFQRLGGHQAPNRCCNGRQTLHKHQTFPLSIALPSSQQEATLPQEKAQGQRVQTQSLTLLGRFWFGLWRKVWSQSDSYVINAVVILHRAKVLSTMPSLHCHA